jgi:hypothetical protein
MMLFQDLQEAFYIVMGPFILYLLLPVFVGTGIVLAVFSTIYDYLVDLFAGNTGKLSSGSGGGMFSGRAREGIFFTPKTFKRK